MKASEETAAEVRAIVESVLAGEFADRRHPFDPIWQTRWIYELRAHVVRSNLMAESQDDVTRFDGESPAAP